MYPTVEARWFYPGLPPEDVRRWFGGLAGPVDDQPSRQDLYLALPGDNLGIKLRQGRIEVKQRVSDLGQLHLHDLVSGRLEHWRKWSFALANLAESLAAVAAPREAWLAVSKARLLRRYSLDEGRLRPLPPLDYAEAGCELELSEVRQAGGQAWWSLAFEAFGPEKGQRDRLTAAAAIILAPAPPRPLEQEHSYSYPRWLRLQAGGDQP